MNFQRVPQPSIALCSLDPPTPRFLPKQHHHCFPGPPAPSCPRNAFCKVYHYPALSATELLGCLQMEKNLGLQDHPCHNPCLSPETPLLVSHSCCGAAGPATQSPGNGLTLLSVCQREGPLYSPLYSFPAAAVTSYWRQHCCFQQSRGKKHGAQNKAKGKALGRQS